MSDHLKVDLTMLAGTAEELRGLADEFESASRFASAYADVGHPRVLDALDEFANNWDRHRDKLTGRLDAVVVSYEDMHLRSYMGGLDTCRQQSAPLLDQRITY